MLILQDWNQLVSKYGNEIANIIFTNCNLHIFLQTMHLKTAQMYSQMIGEATVIQVNTSKNGKSTTKSEQLKGHKLISADDLIKLPSGEAIIFFSKENPARTKLIPWYQTKHYSLKKFNFTLQNQQILNFFDIIYLITKSYFYELTLQNNNKNNPEQLNQKTLLEMELKQWQKQLELFKNLKELGFIEQETKKHIENNINNILEKLK